jgi:hypothetical protein
MEAITDEKTTIDQDTLAEAIKRMPELEEASSRSMSGYTISFPTPSIFSREPIPQPEPESLPAPLPSAIAVQDDAPDADYQALADKLGIRSAALLESKLEAILAEEMIPVYEYAKVEAYLDNLVAKRNYELGRESQSIWGRRAMWSWYSLRKGEHKGIRHGKVVKYVYQQAIEKPVLLAIDLIQSRLPEARFFVSQIEEVADPFLAVTVPGSAKLYVIERWNEPGFRS